MAVKAFFSCIQSVQKMILNSVFICNVFMYLYLLFLTCCICSVTLIFWMWSIVSAVIQKERVGDGENALAFFFQYRLEWKTAHVLASLFHSSWLWIRIMLSTLQVITLTGWKTRQTCVSGALQSPDSAAMW